MNPLIRFHSIVLSITTLTVFYLWEMLTTITISFPDLKVPVAALTSIGIYRLLILLFKALILKIRFLKKWVFGAYYLEGVWIGFFMGKEDKVTFYIETYEQDFDSITIRGKGFRENEGCFGSWIAENVNINVKKGTLNYIYETDAFSNSFINPGLANFVFERKRINDAPYRLIGFSSDLYSPKKLKSFEEKLFEKPDIGNIEIAINKAKELYKQNKYFLNIIE
jgi:hypothetical protein